MTIVAREIRIFFSSKWYIVLVHVAKKNINWVAYKQQNLFLIVQEARKSKVKVFADLVLIPNSQMAVFLLSPHMVEVARVFTGLSFIGVLISFMRTPPIWPSYFPKAQPPNTVILGIRISTTWEIWQKVHKRLAYSTFLS